MSLTSIGIIKADQFVNMMSPLFVKNKKLKMVLPQLRSILHCPLHYFQSRPLYAPFLSDLSTSDINLNNNLRSTAEQYSQIIDMESSTINPFDSMNIDSISYKKCPHYKKNLICSSQNANHFLLVNDKYVSRSIGGENVSEQQTEHANLSRNKFESEMNEKEHIMTLWDYYCEQNSQALNELKGLESRILYLYKEYSKMFIIRDDDEENESNCLYYSTEEVEDEIMEESDDLMSTISEPLPLQIKNESGHESDGTVMTVPSTFYKPKKRRKKIQKIMKKKLNIERTQTDKKYILSRIYADIDFDAYVSPICWSAIRRLYVDDFESVKAAFYANPLSVVNVLCLRLSAKQIEWECERKIAAQIYCDVASANVYKALDMRPKYKRLDKMRLSVTEIWRELIFAQSILNPKYFSLIEGERQKRFCLKEAQREEFFKECCPMDANSTIKPQKNKFSASSHCWYNYGLRFDVNHNFESVNVINLPLSTHEHAWNVFVQYLMTESDQLQQQINIKDSVCFYCNFIFLLFEVRIFHKELLPSIAFEKEKIFVSNDQIIENNEEYLIKIDDLNKLKQIGLKHRSMRFKPLVIDFENDYFGQNCDFHSNRLKMSYHARKSHLIFLNREGYNVLRLYIHLFDRLQKARDFSTERWRLNFDKGEKLKNEARQERNERLFYGKLMALIQGHIKENEFDLIILQLFGPKAYELSNIKHVLKTLFGAISNLSPLMNDVIDLWHFYYPKWQQINPKNKGQRIAFLQRYYQDFKNLICAQTEFDDDNDKIDIVQVEYFLDSKEIGVQFLGQSDNDFFVNECEEDIIRNWQNTNNVLPKSKATKWCKKRGKMLEKYRSKKIQKRINAFVGNETLFLKKQSNKKSKKKHRKKKKKKVEKDSSNFGIWYRPKSHLYFEGVSISKHTKSNKRNKAMHITKIALSKYEKKKKKFDNWHKKRFEEIERNKVHNKKHSNYHHQNGKNGHHNSINLVSSRSTSANGPTMSSAINSMVSSTQQNNLQQFMTINGGNLFTTNNGNASSTAQNAQYAQAQNAQNNALYALAATTTTTTATTAASTPNPSNAYYATYRTPNGTQSNAMNGNASSNQQQQQQQAQYVTAANYPSYYQYGSAPTGYVAIQQQGTHHAQSGTSYVMDNRTGSIYAAIPANYAHSANVNVNQMHNVYAHNQHRGGHHTTQYVSIPNVAQHHVIQNANGQSAVVSMLPQTTQQQQQQQSGNNAEQQKADSLKQNKKKNATKQT